MSKLTVIEGSEELQSDLSLDDASQSAQWTTQAGIYEVEAEATADVRCDSASRVRPPVPRNTCKK